MTNDVAAAVRSRHTMDQWDAYDRLPPLIRAAMQECIVDWCCAWIFHRYRRFAAAMPRDQAVERVLALLDEAEFWEMRRFAVKHDFHGHLDAGASIQRYGAC